MTTDAPLSLGPDIIGRLVTATGAAAARDVRDLGSILFRLPDERACRFTPAGETIRLDAGPTADTIAELAEDAWQDFVSEMATAAGLYYAGRLRFAEGTYADLERWEPALRALLSGRPIFDPATTRLTEPDGCPLDPRRSFACTEGDAPLRHFLRQTGYLHLRGVFSRDDIRRISDVVDADAAAATPGDGRSWWATQANGARALCRLVYLGLRAPAIARLSDEPRLQRLMALADEPLRPVVDRADGHSAVLKPSAVVEGLADLPWHRDCGLGGHPVTCPALNIGIQLDAASAAAGQLHFVPGSWRASCHRHDLARAISVAIDTEPGDCTVHLGDVMHAAPPPSGSGPGRRALYLSCLPARAFSVIPAGKSYNDIIMARVGA